MNNPQELNKVNEFLNNNGISAEGAVRLLCKKRGINVEEFMNSINPA